MKVVKSKQSPKFCVDTSEMSKTEKGVMARAIKSGEEQINFLRNSKEEDSDDES